MYLLKKHNLMDVDLYNTHCFTFVMLIINYRLVSWSSVKNYDSSHVIDVSKKLESYPITFKVSLEMFSDYLFCTKVKKNLGIRFPHIRTFGS